jgi:hypothetical protein
MKEIPEVIYLQWYDDDGIEQDDEEYITWCADRINEDDIEYRLVKKEHDIQRFASEVKYDYE